MRKPRPICKICGKEISSANCGFPKQKKSVVVISESAEELLEKRCRQKGMII
jgi:hypothetical protein